MKIHWRICLLMLFVASVATVGAKDEVREQTSFCFFTRDNCSCLHQSAKSGFMYGPSFFKDRGEDQAQSNRCLNRKAAFTYPATDARLFPIRINEDLTVGQTQGSQPSADAQDLAKKLSNPVASLISDLFRRTSISEWVPVQVGVRRLTSNPSSRYLSIQNGT